MIPVPFNIPSLTGEEKTNIEKVLTGKHFAGDGFFSQECANWLEEHLKTKKALMVTTCTHALEMAAILIGITSGDEVIMPSFTFVSSANAFALRGAKIKFVDIRPDTMNIDEKKIEAAITEKTKAILPVHYAGVACEMDTIMRIADKYNLFVIEDAAQGIMAKYKDKYLGTIGHLGCCSFHETKNIQCGEGGLLLVNDNQFIDRAEIIREKGTDKKQFLRGDIEKYSWVDIGSSYLLSELNAAFLYAQLKNAGSITQHRMNLWNEYFKNLSSIPEIRLPIIPEGTSHNAHIFYIKMENQYKKEEMIEYLSEHKIKSTFHYIPLHSSASCNKHFEPFDDEYTTEESGKLLRLPLYHELSIEKVQYICNIVRSFFN